MTVWSTQKSGALRFRVWRCGLGAYAQMRGFLVTHKKLERHILGMSQHDLVRINE